MASRPSLPYFAPPHLLPAPLPTVADVLTSTRILSNTPKGKVVRVGEHFVVKHGCTVRLQEGENMLFVQQATNIRVPTVYALFYDNILDRNFIVMEYIPGKNLKDHWNNLRTTDKENVVVQLQRYFVELRSLPSPGYFGGVWRQEIIDFWLTGANDPSLVPVQPHDKEEQWVDAMLHVAQNAYPMRPQRFKWTKHVYHTIFRNHHPVFTHGDLNLCNILVHDDGTVVLIDWEHSGWHPSYWEFCFHMADKGFDNDWTVE